MFNVMHIAPWVLLPLHRPRRTPALPDGAGSCSGEPRTVLVHTPQHRQAPSPPGEAGGTPPTAGSEALVANCLLGISR